MGCDDHNAGTIWINFVWYAPTGYSDFEVTFDGETESISRNSYFASGLNRGTPYRFSVKTEASGGRLSSAVSVTVETTCGSVGTACSIGSDGVLYLFFGDGIHRVDLEIAPGTTRSVRRKILPHANGNGLPICKAPTIRSPRAEVGATG